MQLRLQLRLFVTTLRVVWIEMNRCVLRKYKSEKSPPCGWCGLKFHCLLLLFREKRHHLAGGVDWNTLYKQKAYKPPKSPPCGWCGLKFLKPFAERSIVCSHHLAGGVDWNSEQMKDDFFQLCHHLAGGVDWNRHMFLDAGIDEVTTLRVVWIEIQNSKENYSRFHVTTLRVVWIEIHLRKITLHLCLSPPCGWCGLKYFHRKSFQQGLSSPPCGWCGLKYTLFVGHSNAFIVTTLRVVWIEMSYVFGRWDRRVSHHLAGGVDWNGLDTLHSIGLYRHHLAGGVDWNQSAVREQQSSEVTTLRVVWIEIYLSPIIDNAYMVTTLRVVWIEILDVIIRAYTVKPSPPCGWCGLKLKLIRIWTVMEHCHHLAGGVDWNS